MCYSGLTWRVQKTNYLLHQSVYICPDPVRRFLQRELEAQRTSASTIHELSPLTPSLVLLG